jgi:hypothetical protein
MQNKIKCQNMGLLILSDVIIEFLLKYKLKKATLI